MNYFHQWDGMEWMGWMVWEWAMQSNAANTVILSGITWRHSRRGQQKPCADGLVQLTVRPPDDQAEVCGLGDVPCVPKRRPPC